MFSGDRHCPANLSPDELALADSLAGRPVTHHSEMPDAVALEYPAWLDGSLKRAFGDRLSEEMTALNQPAPMGLRVNTLKATFENVYDSLMRENISADPTPFSPLSLRISGHVRIGGSTAYQQGWVEIQDEGSQLVSLLTDAQEGMTVVDFCAGAGGKTLALAASMARDGIVRGRLIACDVFSQRLQRMKSRIKRAGAEGIQRRILSSENDPWVAEQAGAADRVLLDVPCTGTGTWRRHPVDKWRLTPTDLEQSVATQRRIMKSASGMVKPGGRLIYSTCSVLAEENEDQINWFLSENPEYAVQDCRLLWQECVGGEPPTEGPHLHLSPATTLTDGFFCAVLQNTAG
ncbi:MAG: RsmB/NOP family class I SAM-dependent RNA methyltransferase [Alphaproteobacteria bacterium]|nr:RsmB/NOP family class I SAM-dependent RNA methyltransferase [Alphaproteobacteria bacterium]